MKRIITLVLFSLAFSLHGQNKKWTLIDCVNYALENNISIKKNENSILVDEQNVVEAKSNFLPSVSGSFGQRLNIGSGFDPVLNQRINNETTHSFNYNLSVSQTVFNGFRNTNFYKQAQLNR